jgi:hypothetical protein
MSSFQYAGQDEVAFNPASEDLNMNLNLITNVAGIQTFAVAADEVNIGANLRFNDISYAVVISAVGLDEDQAYNLPAMGGTSGQVLGLTGNSGQLIWYSVSGGALAGVTSLNGFTDAVTLQSNNLAITTDPSTNAITIDSAGGAGVASLDGLSGEVLLTATDASIVKTLSGQEIDLRVAVPVPVGLVDGDYPVWDATRGNYNGVAAAPVATLNTLAGLVEIVSMTLSITPDISNGQIALDVAMPYVSALDGLSGEVLLTANNGSIVKELSGQEIDLRVAVPLPAGSTDGDYPTWDTVSSSYGVGTAPVASLNGLNGILGISGGEAIAVETSGAYIIISTALPSGLAVPGVSDETALSFTISGVSVNVTATSVVHATVQYPDNIATPQDAWLVYATPSDANGGSITFFLSSAISSGSTLKIAWMVDKF